MRKIKRLLSEGRLHLCQSSVSRARQVPRDLPVYLDAEERKEPGDEEDRKEGLETREIKALWDRQEKAVSKELWDL